MLDFSLGEYIRIIRQQNDWSAKDMADKLGVSKAYVCNVETGKKGISLKKAIEFSEILKRPKEIFLYLVFSQQCSELNIDFDDFVTSSIIDELIKNKSA